MSEMNALIEKLGMGLHYGPFPLTTNGKKPSYKAIDWPGEAGESVIAEKIEIGGYHTVVVINGERYNSVCFA